MFSLESKSRFVRIVAFLPALVLLAACQPDVSSTGTGGPTEVATKEDGSGDASTTSAKPKGDVPGPESTAAADVGDSKDGSSDGDNAAAGAVESAETDTKPTPDEDAAEDAAEDAEKDAEEDKPSDGEMAEPADSDSADEEHDPEIASPDQPDIPVDPTWKALTNNDTVWVDLKKKAVILSGKVCVRDGQLEMFACTPHTKEYESLVVVDCRAYMVHGALLAVGAKAGSPVKFNPYQAATGSVIDVFVEWLDEKGEKQRVRAQDWIRHDRTGKPMEHDFVFGGSGFSVDEDTGQRTYFAEGGELICVSNFSTATMDLPVRSPQDNQGLWFSTFTDKIPKLETKIHLILVPRQEKKE